MPPILPLIVGRMINSPFPRDNRMCKYRLLKIIFPVLISLSCSWIPSYLLAYRKVVVIEYPPLDWSINGQRLKDLGCEGKLQESCPELVTLGCDKIASPRFYVGGLQPPYVVVECIHENGDPPDKDYFRKPQGLDARYRSFAIFQDGNYKLVIKRSEFKEIFAPIESVDEALSYAMAMTSLSARYDIDPNENVVYLVRQIEETHVEETVDGFYVYLFDESDERMGCDMRSSFAVKVLVTRDGEVQEVNRQEIYKSYSCFDFGKLTLDEK